MPLFYHSGALGDFLLALPFLKAIRTAHTSWTLATREEHAALVSRLFPHERRLSCESRLLSPLSAVEPDRGALAALLERYGGLFGFVREARALEDLSRQLRPRLPVALAEPFAYATAHGQSIEQVLEDVISRARNEAGASLSSEDFAFPLEELPPLDPGSDPLGFLGGASRERVALIHIGASGPSKVAPTSLFREVARRLSELRRTVGWIAGPVEVARGREPPPGPCLLSPSLPLLAHAAAAADLYIGCDTGPTHLASMLGVSTVALHGVENPAWRPRGRKARVVGGAGGFPAADEVLRAVHDLEARSQD